MTGSPIAASVIVCTRHRNLELVRCLSSLRALDPPAGELIVVNSAGSGEAHQIATQFAARYCATEIPGVSHARNVGVAASSFPLLAFIDDDAVAETDWLLPLSAPFTDPQVGATSGTVRPLGECGEWGERYFSAAFGDKREPRLDQNTPDWLWRVNTGGAGVGANMMFRKDALDPDQPFDPRLGRGAPIAGNEEHFAFFRSIAKGYACVQAPEAVVYHPAPTTREQVRQFEIQMAETAGAYLALLFREYPAHRMELLRGVARGAARSGSSAVAPLVTRRERIAGMWRGLRKYRQTICS